MAELSHFDDDGNPQMVDVGSKPITNRVATASGTVVMKAETMNAIMNREIQKGDVLEVARLAGIMATKRASDLIPLCHPLRLDGVTVEIQQVDETNLKIKATVSANERTGVEMEALTAVSVSALTVYDMCKAIDRSMKILEIQLDEKRGGKSGHFKRTET